MNSYWQYWKLGWTALGFIISCNIVLGIVYAGVAMLLSSYVEEPTIHTTMMYAAIVGWLVAGAPFAGWLFKFFASAFRSRAA